MRMCGIVIFLVLFFAGKTSPEEKTILTLDGEFYKSDISLVRISSQVAKTEDIIDSLYKVTGTIPDSPESRVINASVVNKHQRFIRLKQVRKIQNAQLQNIFLRFTKYLFSEICKLNWFSKVQ